MKEKVTELQFERIATFRANTRISILSSVLHPEKFGNGPRFGDVRGA
jgi:hypothetical protein